MGNFSAKFLFSLIFLLCILGFGRGVNAAFLTVKQGEVLLYPIDFPTTTSVLFGGVKMPVFNYGNKKYVLVVADVNKQLGNYNLRIKEGEKELEKKVIQIKAGTYKKIVTKTAYKFTTLPKAEQEAVVKDKAPLVALLSKVVTETKPKLWESIFRNPLDTITATSPFGYKRIYTNHSTTHQGVDLRAKIGTPIYAISDGIVLWGESKALYLEGPTVVIDHGDGIVSKYLHLSKILVQAGAKIKAGEIIGYSGDQGADVQGAHLHFAIKVGNASVNPLQFIKEFQKLK
jgi:murein DD-endopeptidase MepM/ murein hydrolase activator NlpD